MESQFSIHRSAFVGFEVVKKCGSVHCIMYQQYASCLVLGGLSVWVPPYKFYFHQHMECLNRQPELYARDGFVSWLS